MFDSIGEKAFVAEKLSVTAFCRNCFATDAAVGMRCCCVGGRGESRCGIPQRALVAEGEIVYIRRPLQECIADWRNNQVCDQCLPLGRCERAGVKFVA